MAIASDSIAHVARYRPDMLEEVEGIAQGAGVDVVDVMLLQVRNQLLPDREGGCTSIAVGSTDGSGRGPMVAQNWDNDPDLDPFTIVLTRRPTGQPALMTVGQAGLIAYIGFNDAGIGACLNTLPAPSRPSGVPHYFTLRGIYETGTLGEAVEAVRRADRAIPANIMLSTPQGPADLEVTLDEVHVLRPTDPGDVLVHTNHCLHPELRAVADAFPDLIESRARLARVDALLASSPDTTAVLRDHAGHPRSICRHPNPDPATGGWRTTMSVVIEPRDGRMHVSRGNPCERPYETYELH
jgi:isopenicillin-N N-acyltransferase-like protein